MHRFTWDMHYQSLGAGGRGGLPSSAVPYNTVPSPNSPWVAAGKYAVKLTVNGKSYTQPIVVKLDPRVKTPAVGIAQQSDLSKQLYDGVLGTQAALRELRAIRTQVKTLQEKAGQNPIAQALADFDKKAAALEGGGGAAGGGQRGGGGGGFGPGAGGGGDTLAGIGGSLTSLMGLMQAADAAPTSQVLTAVGERQKALAVLMDRWKALKTQDLAALNAQLKTAGLPVIEIKD
jgi:hypothetical protein